MCVGGTWIRSHCGCRAIGTPVKAADATAMASGLVGDCHSAILRRVAASTGSQPQVERRWRDQLPPSARRRLIALDYASGVCRHITSASVAQLVSEVSMCFPVGRNLDRDAHEFVDPLQVSDPWRSACATSSPAAFALLRRVRRAQNGAHRRATRQPRSRRRSRGLPANSSQMVFGCVNLKREALAHLLAESRATGVVCSMQGSPTLKGCWTLQLVTLQLKFPGLRKRSTCSAMR